MYAGNKTCSGHLDWSFASTWKDSGYIFLADFDKFHEHSDDLRTYCDCHFCMHRTLNVYYKLVQKIDGSIKIDTAMKFWNLVYSQNCSISCNIKCFFSIIFHALILLSYFKNIVITWPRRQMRVFHPLIMIIRMDYDWYFEWMAEVRKLRPEVGFELTTSGLLVRRSPNWATHTLPYHTIIHPILMSTWG